MNDLHRSGCPINLTLEVLGDKWSLIIIRDIVFGNKRHFRELLTQSLEGIASNILAEAGLSFLGLGIKEPTPSWGSLLANGPNYYLTQPWLMLWPGLAILSTTLAFNLLGDGLRDAFDPRSAR